MRKINTVMDETYNAAREAYYEAVNNGYTEELQEAACKHPYWACWFAKDVKGADIDYCQELACKDPQWAYFYAKDIKGADIEYCQKAVCKNSQWACCFAKDVVGANLEACLEAVRGSWWEDAVRKLVIEGVVG